MKCINQYGLIIIIILFSGLRNNSQAQQLASEKPVESFYSKTTKEKLHARTNERQPAAQKARQELPSEMARAPQPSVPAQIQPKKKISKRATYKAVSPGDRPRLASQRPVDMDKINKQRSRKSH
jgi:hypothetical protein